MTRVTTAVTLPFMGCATTDPPTFFSTIAPLRFEILGGGAVAGHAGEEIEEWAVVALEQDLEPGHVAPAHGTHEGLVSHDRVLS